MYNFVRNEVLTSLLMNMPAMRTAICIPSQEPASSIFRAVQEKHSPWTTMKLNAASPSKTITPTYQTTLHCNPRKPELYIYLMASELIQGSIRRMLGFTLQDITFPCQLLHKESKSLKKNSNRAIQDGPKLVYTYVASFNPPPCKTMYVLVGTKAPIAFPSHNLLVRIVKWDSYP